MPLTRARLRISEYSKGRKNRVKDIERKSQIVTLSLTSMVDLFATMVIYLLLNSSSLQEWVELGFKIDLPKAKADWSTPERSTSIQITRDKIVGEGVGRLTTMKKVMEARSAIPEIKYFLAKYTTKKGYVNIVADYNIPFVAMKKIIATCQEAGFDHVNLAVQPDIPSANMLLKKF